MEMWDKILGLFEKIKSIDFGIFDLLDILLVTFLIYEGIKIIRETRAVQIFKGVLLIALCYFIVYTLDMQASSYIFRTAFKDIIILVIVIFQPEIRQLVERLGKSRVSVSSILRRGYDDVQNEEIKKGIIEICKAVQRMSENKTGALIVFERENLLNDIVSTGTKLDAEISHELIGNIFFPNSPLHDGAVLIRDARVTAAGCVLPLTDNNDDVSSDLGTRHRAAIGMSEVSDSIVIVVSEETGGISVASGGKLKMKYSEAALRAELMSLLTRDSTDENENGSMIKRLLKGKKR
ncbi:MAG: diadenylate cyclase CdaA [Clostridia bacterium]|nr:diadenylate cyclase CdaA [Clostridia bacterium]